MFSYRNFMVLGFVFRCMIPIELIFCIWCMLRFIFLHMENHLFQHHLLKGLSFLHCITLVPLSKKKLAIMCKFISRIHSVLLICMSFVMPIPYSLDSHSFVECLVIRSCESSNFVSPKLF